ncbi:hypothetical protein [Sedimenticola sp.]|uniref:hypothetical protein n=1 Tax=Sedimenticola sp. TaxID=1940285 RepID=UPI003D10CCA2
MALVVGQPLIGLDYWSVIASRLSDDMSKIAILIVVVLIIAAGIYSELQRGNNLTHTAKRLGLDFSSGLQPVTAELRALDFDLLRQGNENLANRMWGRRDGYSIEIFDYSFDATAAGEGFGAHPVADDQVNIERRNQTVVRLQSTATFPDFDLSPVSGPMRQVASRFAFTPQVLEANRAFGQTYRLLARDAERCRKLFSPEVQAFLISHPGLVVEGRGSQLLFYRFGRRLKAKEIPSFVAEVQALIGLLEAAMEAA